MKEKEYHVAILQLLFPKLFYFLPPPPKKKKEKMEESNFKLA